MRFFIAICLLAFVLIPSIHADQQYSIPTTGCQWPTHSIHVLVNATGAPAIYVSAVAQAMAIWNNSQKWFKETYHPNGNPFYFALNVHGPVQVKFVNQSREWLSLTEYLCRGGLFTRAVVSLTLHTPDGGWFSGLVVRTMALHELGHVLGLGHTDIEDDLMNERIASMWAVDTIVDEIRPSTLDLYGVYSASRHAEKVVSLPTSIPYVQWVQVAIPEFPLGLVPLLLTLTPVVCTVGRRKRMRGAKWKDTRRD